MTARRWLFVALDTLLFAWLGLAAVTLAAYGVEVFVGV
jgi:hypothetical protein